jgi:hypothetical protein
VFKIKCAGRNNFKTKSIKRIIYFEPFFDIVAADPEALFAFFYPLLKGGGVVVLGDGLDDPLPALLEALLGD